jgi:proteasome lid subunit RPN8/RPN11
MDAIQLRAAVRAEMVAHARRETPRECCGLLAGAGSLIDECVPGRNIDPDPRRYRLDPALHIESNRRLRGTGRAVQGAYHSHPHSPPIPSETDRLEAYYEEFVWVIVSLSVPEPGAVAAYRLSGGRFVPVAIEMVP